LSIRIRVRCPECGAEADLTAVDIELIVPTSTGKEDVALEIFDGAGRSVTTLTHSVRKGNRCLFHWSGTDRKGTKLPSGIYLLLPRGEGVAEELRTKGERLILLRQKG